MRRRSTLAAVTALAAFAGCGGVDAVVPARPAPQPPGFVEIREPPEDPRGVILTIHGGGWQDVGEAAARAEDGNGARYLAQGWAVVNVDYRPGRRALDDVIAWHDWVLARWPTEPVCAAGSSAGAHLALMLAARRPEVACVIGFGAITDLDRVGDTKEARELRRDFVVPSFGSGDLSDLSPITYARDIGARVLLITSRDDRIAPCDQIRRYGERDPDAQVMCPEGGAEPFVHAGLSERSVARWTAAETALLAAPAG
jgi:acetyl esterase/lipase